MNKQNKTKSWGYRSVVKYLPSMHKALGLILSHGGCGKKVDRREEEIHPSPSKFTEDGIAVTKTSLTKALNETVVPPQAVLSTVHFLCGTVIGEAS
jgi:hypothetical protein